MLKGSPAALVKGMIAVPAGKAALLATLVCASIVAVAAAVPPAKLTADPPRWPFAVTGVLTELLAPDVTSPVELTVTNASDIGLTVTRLTVQIAEIRTRSGGRPCLPTNFVVTQFSGAYGFAIAADRTTSLTGLGIAKTAWPRLTMLDLPLNQDACRDVAVTLRITGEAHK